jgi:NitT/TauT family transport system permease protein
MTLQSVVAEPAMGDGSVVPVTIDFDRRLKLPSVIVLRCAVVAAVLGAWQYLPQWLWLRHYIPVLDPFFVSSPSLVAVRLGDLLAGSGDTPAVWPYLWFTLQGMLIGAALGIALGMSFGLAFSNDPRLRQVLNPFVNAVNATPRIALVPVFVIMLGPTIKSSVAVAVTVVFFAVFYNAYVGGSSIAKEMIQNSVLLGATRTEVMWRVRMMHVLVWTFASLPNAISLALISVITAEILSGSGGMGQLIVQALQNNDATLTFSVVVLLAIIGTLLVSGTDWLKRRVLHWWPGVHAE